MKLHVFNQLLFEENFIYKFNLYLKKRCLYNWLNRKSFKLQLIMLEKIQLLKRQAPYILRPFEEEWQFNIWIWDFPIIDS
jgi:hypothetical protein